VTLTTHTRLAPRSKKELNFTSTTSVFILGFRVTFTLISALDQANLDGIRAMYREDMLVRESQISFLIIRIQSIS
jgi:hypothetical protein